ncbi:MAG: 1-deoxy-D-xylulose-5-phosphate synthase N-terminal domain-containing protein, partial [Beijerinckiaceae bacterium]
MSLQDHVYWRSNIDDAEMLRLVERKLLWLSSWTIHHANHIRPSRDGLKVGGHQASCASAVSLMTALFMRSLKPEDRIAVKPHAAPVFHAIQYMLGRQTQRKLMDFRALGGAQAYPSRTKDTDGVDFSTGSVGLGVGITLLATIVRDYLLAHRLAEPAQTGKLVAIMGDAELDEGNVFEALLEGWKHDVQNLWWVVDYNRHSLDGTVNDHLFQKITSFFETVGWRVVNLKYGKLLQQAFAGPAGEALQRWIDECPNQLYSALTYKAGAAWREHLKRDLAGTQGIAEFLDSHSDDSLHTLMTNLGGHDMETLMEAFDTAGDNPTPHCFIAYTIKGWGLPLAGHRDNHAGLLNPSQMEEFRRHNNLVAGEEWDKFAGLGEDGAAVEAFLEDVPWRRKPLVASKRPLVLKTPLRSPAGTTQSTQGAFGNILNAIASEESELVSRIVTTSPDVAVSTNLAPWINKRGVFHRSQRADTFQDEKVASPLKWVMNPQGQHIELGIAENNLFLMLAALGLSESLYGERLFPVGTVYDPFVNRGLDALIYGCYQGARFMVAGTPSGIALAPEGGAHQSINTPLVGMSIPNLVSFEPAYADELAAIMEWGLGHMQRSNGGSVYLRLSTRAIEQARRVIDEKMREHILSGAYWREHPTPGSTIIAYTGAVAPEAAEAHAIL